jgi:hypothetical protein
MAVTGPHPSSAAIRVVRNVAVICVMLHLPVPLNYVGDSWEHWSTTAISPRSRTNSVHRPTSYYNSQSSQLVTHARKRSKIRHSPTTWTEPGSSVSIVTGYGLGDRGSIPGGGGGFFFYPLRPAGSASHNGCRGNSPGVNAEGAAANRSPPSCAEVKKERSYNSSPPMCHVGTIRDTFTFATI